MANFLRAADAAHSSLIPVSFTIPSHALASSALTAANSLGVQIFTSRPRLAKLPSTSEERRHSLMAVLSLATIGPGVAAGASNPNQISEGYTENPISNMGGHCRTTRRDTRTG